MTPRDNKIAQLLKRTHLHAASAADSAMKALALATQVAKLADSMRDLMQSADDHARQAMVECDDAVALLAQAPEPPKPAPPPQSAGAVATAAAAVGPAPMAVASGPASVDDLHFANYEALRQSHRDMATFYARMPALPGGWYSRNMMRVGPLPAEVPQLSPADFTTVLNMAVAANRGQRQSSTP